MIVDFTDVYTTGTNVNSDSELRNYTPIITNKCLRVLQQCRSKAVRSRSGADQTALRFF